VTARPHRGPIGAPPIGGCSGPEGVFKSFEDWARVHEDRKPTHGYAATREAAMAAFAKSWRRE
jgi:hypothetical protein